eukprot:scaffold2485_cov158-Pinguiococcus_pyrenoidosus.AAC.1
MSADRRFTSAEKARGQAVLINPLHCTALSAGLWQSGSYKNDALVRKAAFHDSSYRLGCSPASARVSQGHHMPPQP